METNNIKPGWKEEFEYSFGVDHPARKMWTDHDDYLLVKDFIQQEIDKAVKEEREKNIIIKQIINVKGD